MPGAGRSIKEEDELEAQEKRGVPRRIRRRRVRVRRGGLRRRWRRRRARGPAVVVVHGDRVQGRRGSRLHHGVGPPAPGVVPRAEPADRRGDPLPARAAGLEGRGLQHRLPVVRQRDCPGRQVGLGQVLGERQRLRRERQGDRGDRHVQLRLRGDRDPGAEPGAGRRHRDGLTGEHVSVPHGQPPRRLRHDRAGQVLPVGDAQLRPCRGARRLPGRGPGRVHAERGDQERLHPQRQGGVRPRRRDDDPQGGGVPRDQDRRLRGVGSRRRRATRRRCRRSSRPGRTRCSSAG